MDHDDSLSLTQRGGVCQSSKAHFTMIYSRQPDEYIKSRQLEIAIVDADNKIMIVSLLRVRWPINEHGAESIRKKKESQGSD